MLLQKLILPTYLSEHASLDGLSTAYIYCEQYMQRGIDSAILKKKKKKLRQVYIICEFFLLFDVCKSKSKHCSLYANVWFIAVIL